MKNRILPEFQDFLLSRSLVPAKNAPFYAHWVSEFLAFSNKNQDLGPDLRVQKFLTLIYTHVVRDMVSVPQSPLDNLYAKKRL